MHSLSTDVEDFEEWELLQKKKILRRRVGKREPQKENVEPYCVVAKRRAVAVLRSGVAVAKNAVVVEDENEEPRAGGEAVARTQRRPFGELQQRREESMADGIADSRTAETATAAGKTGGSAGSGGQASMGVNRPVRRAFLEA